MSVQITYFVHGTSVDNEKGVSSGWSDPALSELGIEQSKGLSQQIGDKKFDVVFCSDLKRAEDSAHLAFEGMAPILADNRLRECSYGKYNGKPSKIVEPMQKKHISVPFPDGESYEDVKKRTQDFLDELKQKYDGKHVAIVAHKAPQFSLNVLINRKSWDQVFAEDWRLTKSWQPGWEYNLN